MAHKIVYWGDDGVDRYPKCPFCSTVIKDGGVMQWGEARKVDCVNCKSSFTACLQNPAPTGHSCLIEPKYYTEDERELLKLRAAIKETLEMAGNHYLDWGDRAEKCFEILEKAIDKQ